MTRDLSKTIMNAIRKSASVKILLKLSSVNCFFKPKPSFKIPSGDIAVSGKTVSKLLKTSGDQNAALWNAYPDSEVDLWDQNIVNGEYIIAYEMNLGLDPKLKNMLPKVRFRLS